jgi:guanylate kinase
MSGLTHYQEFSEILRDYRMSERAQQALKELKLVLLIAPTSGGRNTIIRYLVGTEGYHYIVSDTTRAPRINDGILEENGREYWFRSEEEVLQDLRAGEYLEAEILHSQQVSGISIRELEKAQQQNKVAVTDIDLEGIHNILKAKPGTWAVMIVPPSFDEWQRRIAGRGVMSPQEYDRRLETAYKIFDDGLKQTYYQFVISENVEQSAAIIKAIVNGGHNPHQDRGRTLVSDLHTHLKETLRK